MEFVCPSSTAMVRAANVKATLDAFNLVPELGKEITERHQLHLRDMREDAFLPVQHWLNALKEIQDRMGTSVVRKVGAGIIANAMFPPQFTTVESVLEALDAIYYLNHQGDVGHYRVTRLSDTVTQVKCETCYPRHFERGLIEGISQKKELANGGFYVVKYEDGPPKSDVTCTLTVTRHNDQKK